jgi:hypothetical protein
MSGQQMSDKWINTPPGNSSTNRLDAAVGKTEAANIRAAAAPAQPGQAPPVEKVVFSSKGHGQPVTTQTGTFLNNPASDKF